MLATLSLFSNGIKYLGNNAIVGIIVAVIFAYFMGLYTNEMPNPGTDGFSLKIRQTMKQASVADINLNSPNLVQICESIPIQDKKLDKILQNGQFRNLTKPTEVGGDIDTENIPMTTEDNSSNLQAEPLTTEPLTTEPNLENKLNELKTQLAESEKNINNGADAYKNYALKAKLQPEIDKLEQQLNTQTGGKKYKQRNKKYDIKWT